MIDDWVPEDYNDYEGQFDEEVNMRPRNCERCENGSCMNVGHEMTVKCDKYVGKTYPELDQLWDEMDEAAMNDRRYSRDDEAWREEVREPEWDAARDMEEGES